MSSHLVVAPDDTWDYSGNGPGLLLDVPAQGKWLQRPSLRAEVVADRYYPGEVLLRLVRGAQPALWIRIWDYFERCQYVRGPSDATWGLRHLSAADVRRIAHEPLSEAWWSGWMRRWLRELEAAPNALLHSGRWCLRPAMQLPPFHRGSDRWGQYLKHRETPWTPRYSREVLTYKPAWEERSPRGELLPLRPPSPEGDGRVKAWRKHVRAGTLPPVLLLYCSLIRKWLVADGHDRLQAALLEGREPPLLGLWYFIEEEDVPDSQQREEAVWAARMHVSVRVTPANVNGANLRLRDGFETRLRWAHVRAWPVPGGALAWKAEVSAWGGRHPAVRDHVDWNHFVNCPGSQG